MRLRTGLVLGAGGVLGAAWTIGALRALEDVTGFDPRTADHLLGTSAGSVVAAALGAGVPVRALADHQLGVETADAARIDFDPATGSGGRYPRVPRPGLGSRELVAATWRDPRAVHPLIALSSVVPRGRGDLEPVGRLVDSVNPGHWSPHPALWVAACDYERGRRVLFGRPGAPPARLRDAVMASCAVPAWYAPVPVLGRRYVDGGVRSATSAACLAGSGLDRVYVLAPMASYAYDRPRSVPVALERGMRRISTRRLDGEVAPLRRAGVAVHLLTPGPEDLDAIGFNLMDPARRAAVLETAVRTTTARLAAADERSGCA